jgi:hypothetical protein
MFTFAEDCDTKEVSFEYKNIHTMLEEIKSEAANLRLLCG